jgi:hypothetical protein
MLQLPVPACVLLAHPPVSRSLISRASGPISSGNSSARDSAHDCRQARDRDGQSGLRGRMLVAPGRRRDAGTVAACGSVREAAAQRPAAGWLSPASTLASLAAGSREPRATASRQQPCTASEPECAVMELLPVPSARVPLPPALLSLQLWSANMRPWPSLSAWGPSRQSDLVGRWSRTVTVTVISDRAVTLPGGIRELASRSRLRSQCTE